MAAYRRVDDLTVTCGLTACTPGSAPGPTLGVEYGKPLHLPLHDSSTLRTGNASDDDMRGAATSRWNWNLELKSTLI